MANSQAGLILQHIRKLAATGSEPLADRELVQRFVSARDEAAFAMLVRRHGQMVLRVCQRVLHNAHDAEDAFQATFLVLSRKAGSLRHPELVGNWLYGVAHRLALKAGIYASRRWAHESQVAARPPIDPLAELTGRELIAVLDEELSRLAEKYRAPLVLCCLEGTARDKAAQQLGWSLSTLKRRLEYGRKLLRRRLARRGLALSAALSASLLTADTGHAAVSATLIASTIQAALSYQSGQTVAVAGISKQAAALAEGVLRAALITKVKIAAVLFLAISVGAAEAALLARQVLEGKPAEAKEQAEPKSVASIPDQAKAEATNPTRFDPFGDPLPLGALARFGTVRWRHGDQVMAIAFSPDGTTVASGSMDEAIHLWDARTGKLLRILRGHEAWVGSVFFTPDGKELISCSRDQTARVWDVATGKEVRRWPTHGSLKLALSSDGKLLAGAGASPPNGSIVLWDVTTGNPVRELSFEDVQDGVTDLAFSPDGTRLVSGGGSTLRLFDVTRGKQLQTFGAGTRINSVAFSSDGKTLAVGRNQEPVTLWDVADLKEPRRLGSDPKGARVVTFSPDGKTLAVCGFGFGTAMLWDVTTGKKVCELQGILYQVWSVAFSPDGKTLAVGHLASRVRLWDTSTGKELPSVEGHREWVQFLAFVDHDRGIASASSEGMVRHWDIATAKVVREFQEDGTQCYCGNLSPDGRTLALGDGAGAHLFEWSTGKKLRLLKGHKLQVWAVAFSPKGDVLASSANMDQNILLWDVASGRELRRILTPHQHDLRCVAWSPNGKVLASAGAKGDNLGKIIDTVCIWNPATGEQLGEWVAHRRRQDDERYAAGVNSLVFSPDGTLLAAAGGDKTVNVWDVATGRMRARLLGHQRGAMALAFSPDGRMLASGGMDRTVRLWELSTWQERRRYEGHLGGIFKLAFSADGLTLASAGGDTSVLLWSVTGRDPRARQPNLLLARRELENLWNDLASDDASRAWRAVCTLTSAPQQAIPWLNEHLKPMSAADLQRITRLIGDLDSNQFATRRQAVLELEKLGELARPALRKALERQPTAEVRRQVERLLERPEGPAQGAEILRELRALEVLEQAGTDQARQVLEALAKGAPEAHLTQGAKAALERLAKQVSADQ